MKEQLEQFPVNNTDVTLTSSVMRVSRKWLCDEFVDISHLSDQAFIEIMAAAGYDIVICHPIHKSENGIPKITNADDAVIEFTLNRNRPDCFSVMGFARDLAAVFGVALKHHEPVLGESDAGSIYELLDVDVPAFEMCNRYTTKMVTNVKIGTSPEWMRQRLEACGICPVNNILDIANYVMLEYGQPVHVFDYRMITSGQINVRVSEEGELLETTADGTPDQLRSGTLIIADGDQPIALAGFAGGKIECDTTAVVLEAANYSARSIKQTGVAYGLRTNASERFEKNLDPMMTVPAIERVCELVEQLSCGEVLDGMIDILNYVPEPRIIEYDPAIICDQLGADLSEAEVAAYMCRLGLPVQDGVIWVPSFRQDLVSIASIAGEIARLRRCDAV